MSNSGGGSRLHGICLLAALISDGMEREKWQRIFLAFACCLCYNNTIIDYAVIVI